jgi:hypothetical protein
MTTAALGGYNDEEGIETQMRLDPPGLFSIYILLY